MGASSDQLRLAVSQFEHRGQVGARVRDGVAGVTYSVVAGGRTATGRPALTYVAVEVDEGMVVDEVKQLAHSHLALIAAEIAADVEAARVRDAAVNERIRLEVAAGSRRSNVVGVGTYLVGLERDRPAGETHPVLSPSWTARLVRECRASNAPAIATIADLAEVSASTARRAIQRAVEAGLLEPQRRGRPAHTPKETPSV